MGGGFNEVANLPNMEGLQEVRVASNNEYGEESFSAALI
jgi:hypothetical protein